MNNNGLHWDALNRADRSVLIAHAFLGAGNRITRPDHRRIREAQWLELSEAERNALYAIDWNHALSTESKIEVF